jgi:PAS domain S-box-containing protein
MNWPRLSQWLALLAAGFGGLSLAGWVLDLDALKRLHTGWVSMKANTAVCLILAGISVALLRDEDCARWKRRIAHGCAVFVFVIGALTLGENLFGWELGLDQALFRESLESAGRSFPGRMGPASATVFMLLGTAILTLDGRSSRGKWPQICATTAAAITLLIFLCYFYDVELPPWMRIYASIALHTVMAFLLLCAAILLSRPERGFVAVFLADSTSGRIARRMLPVALLVPSLLGWIFVMGRLAGFYGVGVAVALLAASVTVIFTFLVWWLARALEYADAQRRRTEESLRRSERELADFFDNASVGLHWVGPDGTILRANDMELSMLGYKREEYVGRNIADFHVSEPVINDILTRLKGDEKLLDYPAQMRCRDGTIRSVLIHSSVYWENGEFIHTRCFTRDVTPYKSAEAARDQLAAIVGSSEDAIVSKDLDGVVTSWNAGAERLFGFTAAEMIGQPMRRLFPADRSDEEDSILLRLRKGQQIPHHDTIRLTKDGRLIPVSVTISPIHDAVGTVIGASIIARDITQRKQIEEELRAARDAAEAASRAKDEFLATLSHELRTPLTPVLMLAAEMEQAATLPPELREDFRMIRKNVELEARIIDDLLDLTRITRGKLDLRFGTVAVHELIEDSLAILRSDSQGKDITITLDLSAAHHYVSGDAARLQQVFWNVLKNATKFTPAGGQIGIRTWNENARLRVAISDTGLGITAGEMPRIFTAFEQGRVAETARFGGLGLGLSISALLMREHQGSIHAESPGRDLGSTFHLDFPVITAAVAGQTPMPAPGRESAAMRILLVEDHDDTRRLLQRLMTRWGHTVTVADNVAAARAAIAEGTFDAVLSDLGLPDGTGLDVVKALREISDIPAIAMSGYGMEADLARSRAAGFNEHLIKPVNPAALRTLLAQLSGTAPVHG